MSTTALPCSAGFGGAGARAHRANRRSGESSASGAITKRTPRRWASRSIEKRRSTSPKPPSTTSRPESTVPYPPGTNNYHYELELVAVIGAPAFRIPADRARELCSDTRCGLDMTRRDLQLVAREQRRPWDLGKDVEESAVLAEIVPATDIGHPTEGRIELRAQWRNEAAIGLVAADSRCARDRRSPVDLLPPAGR